MYQKQQFIAAMQAATAKLAQAKEELDRQLSIYFDVGFNPAGAEAITDADCAPYGILAADVTNGITLSQQLDNMWTGAAVTVGTYRTTVSRLRNDF
jgi:hypothetical protein